MTIYVAWGPGLLVPACRLCILIMHRATRECFNCSSRNVAEILCTVHCIAMMPLRRKYFLGSDRRESLFGEIECSSKNEEIILKSEIHVRGRHDLYVGKSSSRTYSSWHLPFLSVYFQRSLPFFGQDTHHESTFESRRRTSLKRKRLECRSVHTILVSYPAENVHHLQKNLYHRNAFTCCLFCLEIPLLGNRSIDRYGHSTTVTCVSLTAGLIAIEMYSQ